MAICMHEPHDLECSRCCLDLAALPRDVRVAREVDPRTGELTMTYMIGKEDDSQYASRPSQGLAHTVPREPADYPHRAGSGVPRRQTA